MDGSRSKNWQLVQLYIFFVGRAFCKALDQHPCTNPAFLKRLNLHRFPYTIALALARDHVRIPWNLLCFFGMSLNFESYSWRG